jgi:hypothetical protein
VPNGKVNDKIRKGLEQAIVGQLEVLLYEKFPEGTEENRSKDSWRPGRDKNRAPSECKPKVLQHEVSSLSKGRTKENVHMSQI